MFWTVIINGWPHDICDRCWDAVVSDVSIQVIDTHMPGHGPCSACGAGIVATDTTTDTADTDTADTDTN